MNEDNLKLLLIRDKVFLKQLYSGPNVVKNKSILLSAENSELNTLLYYLHFVANGKIPITKNNFQALKKSKKLTFIQKKIEKDADLSKLVNSSRKIKLNFLIKISTSFPNLLYALFNLM